MKNVNMNLPEMNITEEQNVTFNTTPFGNSTVPMPLEAIVDGGIFRDVQNFVFFPVVFFIGLFGNISTIIVFWRKKQKTASNMFIIGLACTDFLFILLRVVTHVYTIGHIHFTESFRYILPNSFFWSLLAHTPQRIGFLFVVVIVVERITAVWFPLKLKQVWTTRLSRIVSVIVVLLPMGDLVTVVDILLFSMNEPIPEKGPLSTTIEVARYVPHQGKAMATLSVIYRICFDLLPLPLVFILNIVIIVGIRRNTFSKHGPNVKSQQRKDREGKTTRMLLMISVLFFLLCSPYNVLINLSHGGFVDGTKVTGAVYGALFILNILNSVINFVVYGVNDSNLRKDYLKLWRCCTEIDSDPYITANDNRNMNKF